MKVSQVPYDELRVGDRVQSDLSGAYGMIVNKYFRFYYHHAEPDSRYLVVRWERFAAQDSHQPHANCCHLTYIG